MSRLVTRLILHLGQPHRMRAVALYVGTLAALGILVSPDFAVTASFPLILSIWLFGPRASRERDTSAS